MPWDLHAWQDRLERLSSPLGEAWTPPIDVYETPHGYVVTAELPGLHRDEISLEFERSRLTIRGQRPDRPAVERVHYHQIERGHGRFARSFEFADAIDASRATAELTDGVLTVTLPKAPPPPPRRIDVG